VLFDSEVEVGVEGGIDIVVHAIVGSAGNGISHRIAGVGSVVAFITFSGAGVACSVILRNGGCFELVTGNAISTNRSGGGCGCFCVGSAPELGSGGSIPYGTVVGTCDFCPPVDEASLSSIGAGGGPRAVCVGGAVGIGDGGELGNVEGLGIPILD